MIQDNCTAGKIIAIIYASLLSISKNFRKLPQFLARDLS